MIRSPLRKRQAIRSQGVCLQCFTLFWNSVESAQQEGGNIPLNVLELRPSCPAWNEPKASTADSPRNTSASILPPSSFRLARIQTVTAAAPDILRPY